MEEQAFNGTYEELTAMLGAATEPLVLVVQYGMLTNEQMDDLKLGGVEVEDRVVATPIISVLGNGTTVVTTTVSGELVLTFDPADRPPELEEPEVPENPMPVVPRD